MLKRFFKRDPEGRRNKDEKVSREGKGSLREDDDRRQIDQPRHETTLEENKRTDELRSDGVVEEASLEGKVKVGGRPAERIERERDPMIAKRERKAAESILDNEALTEDLDDDGAKALIQWGVDQSKAAAQGTFGLNDEEAEAFMYPRMRATRKLLRTVSKFAAEPTQLGSDDQASLLDQINEQLKTIYGSRVESIDHSMIDGLRGQSSSQAEFIVSLRQEIEKLTRTS